MHGKTIKISYFFILTFLIFSCNIGRQSDYTDDEFKRLDKDLQALKLQKRLVSWDSILLNKKLSEKQRAVIYFYKANDLNKFNDYNKALSLYNKALRLFQKNKDELYQAKTYINMGVSYALLKKKSDATETILKGLEIANRLKDSHTINRAYGQLAHLYYLNGDKDKAIEYLKKALELQIKEKDTLAMYATYNNLAATYCQQKKYDEAYECTVKSQEINQSIKDELSLIIGYNNLGRIVLKQNKDTDRALEYFRKALKLVKENKLKNLVTYDNLATVFLQTNRLDSAEYYLQKALDCNIDNIADKIDIYNQLIITKLKKGENEKAIAFLKIKDSLANIREEQVQNEAKKSLENDLMYVSNQKQLEQARQLNKKNRVIFSFIIIIFILGILISYQLNKLDKLRYKQEKFMLEQKVLRSQMNPHFIFNVLSSIQSTLIENNPVKSATYLSKFAQLIRQNFDFVQKRYISLHDEIQMIINYMDTQKLRYKDKFDYEIIIDEKINQEFTQIPPMILQPFIENAIEHGFKNINYKGLLKIIVTKKNRKICFEIIDNGKGFDSFKNDGKEHALDIFKRRLEIIGKEEIDSFKITNLEKGAKFSFCLAEKYFNKKNTV